MTAVGVEKSKTAPKMAPERNVIGFLICFVILIYYICNLIDQQNIFIL